MPKKRVLLTGASGSMGSEAFKELLRRKDRYDIVLLLRPSKQNKKAFANYEGQEGIKIVWGDYRNMACCCPFACRCHQREEKVVLEDLCGTIKGGGTFCGHSFNKAILNTNLRFNCR